MTPIDAIRSELERIKGWPDTLTHHADALDRRCMTCGCGWPCTEAEVAQDAAKVAKALERAVAALDAVHQHGDAINIPAVLADIARILKGE